MVDQRNEGASVRADTFGITFDQWFFFDAGGVNGANAQHIASDIPGFARMLRITATGLTSLTGDNGLGQDLLLRDDLASGTPSALPMYAKIVGRCSHNAVLPLQIGDFNSPSAQNFWHLLRFKAGVVTTFDIPITPNTIFDITSGGGSFIQLDLRAISTAPNGDAVLDKWAGSTYAHAKFTGQTDFTALTGATLDLALVDLRPSSAALPVIHDSFEQHLFECQYFFQKLGYEVGSPGNGWTGDAPGSVLSRDDGFIVNLSSQGNNATIPFLRSMIGRPTLIYYDSAGSSGKVDYFDTTWNTDGVTSFQWGGRGGASFTLYAGSPTWIQMAYRAALDAGY